MITKQNKEIFLKELNDLSIKHNIGIEGIYNGLFTLVELSDNMEYTYIEDSIDNYCLIDKE